ncbi:MAG: hypothetical protein ACRCV0_06100 [Brevinema sp.]
MADRKFCNKDLLPQLLDLIYKFKESERIRLGHEINTDNAAKKWISLYYNTWFESVKKEI